VSLLDTVIYKPCPDKCETCQQCLSFAKVVGQIDLKKRSRSDRERTSLEVMRRLSLQADDVQRARNRC
jgi:hypothetical protein